MNVKALLVASLVSLATLTSAATLAKPHQSGVKMYRVLLSERAAEKLDLTVVQQTQIKEIVKAEKKAIKAFRETQSEHRKVIKELIRADNFDETSFRQALASGEVQRTEFRVLKAKNENKVWNLLTSEQQEKFKALKQKVRNKMNQRAKRLLS